MSVRVIKELISGFWQNEKVKKPYFILNKHSTWSQDVSGQFLEKSDLQKMFFILNKHSTHGLRMSQDNFWKKSDLH